MSIARNTVYNLLGTSLPVLVSLATVPAYLAVIGLERYGALSICWMMLGYFGLFDFGLGRAAAQRIASLAGASPADRSAVFWVALSLSVLLAVIATLLFVPAVILGFGALKFEAASMAAEVAAAVPWLAAAVPFAILNGVLAGALEGRERFLTMNIANGVSNVASALLPLAAALWIGPQLWVLIAAALFARFLGSAMMARACVGAVPLYRPTKPARAEIAGLLRFGGWATVSNIVAPLLVYWDRFIIGATIGSAAVSIYVVPFNIINYMTILPIAIAGAIFPRLAASSATDAQHLAAEAVKVLAFVMTPAALAVLILCSPFFHLWLGSKVATAAAPIAYILIFGMWVNAFARVPAATLLARGRPNLFALLHLAEVFPYLGLLYICIKWFGVEGAALAWSVRCTADAIALFMLSKLTSAHLRVLFVHGGALCAAIAIALILSPSSVARWALLGGILLGMTLLVLKNAPPRVMALFRESWSRALPVVTFRFKARPPL